MPKHRTEPEGGPEAGSAVRVVTVEHEEADRRLDNFLLARLKGVPRAHVYRIIRSGQVRVNSRRAGPDRRLEAGDKVRIPPVRIAPGGAAGRVHPDKLRWIEPRVIYEDSELLVLDKPAGLAVHGGSGVSLGAIELLRAVRPDARSLALVHRLDRDTSGCLLIAKKHSALRRLQAQFREGSVEKIYTALLLGRLAGNERTVNASLTTSERRGGERHVRVDSAGKPAATRMLVEQRLPGVTLVRIFLMTGRTHQIRVHAAHIGHPVAGDERYGESPGAVLTKCGLKRLFLHAASIAFDSPKDERVIRVESPLPADLEVVLKNLRAVKR